MKNLTRFRLITSVLLFSGLISAWPYLVLAQNGDISGIWDLVAQGISVGCTEHTPCGGNIPPYNRCGTDVCGFFQMGDPYIHVSQSGTVISASGVDCNGHPYTLDGVISGNSVTFTIQGGGITPGIGPVITTYTGTLDGNIINGDFSGYASWTYKDENGNLITETATWTGTFTVIIEKPECNVKIIGSPAIVIYEPALSSPKVILDTITDPPSGNYEWTILSGQDKVRFVGNTNSESAVIQGIAPSEENNDVAIKVTYMIESQICEATHYITVQKPTLLKVLDGYPKTEVQYNNTGKIVDYTTTYGYQVMDQLNPANPIYAKMKATELIQIVCANQWYVYLTSIYFRSILTNDLGIFEDELQPPLKRFGPPIPVNLLCKYQQRIEVAGWPMDIRCLIYYYDHATSEEGICGKCK